MREPSWLNGPPDEPEMTGRVRWWTPLPVPTDELEAECEMVAELEDGKLVELSVDGEPWLLSSVYCPWVDRFVEEAAARWTDDCERKADYADAAYEDWRDSRHE